MSRLRSALRRPVRDQPRSILAALAVAVVLALAAILMPALRGGERDGAATAPSVRPAGPVIDGTGGRSAQRPPSQAVASADVPRARSAARAFLRSYLPVLYGRGRPDGIEGVVPQLRRSLREARRVPRRIRDRRPRLTRLDAQPQAPTSVLMTATVDDGVVAPFRLIFTVERQPDGRWLVTNVAND